MNAGFSNLATLKRHLLAPAIAAQTKYDETIADIGLAVASEFELRCNRRFARVVGDKQEFQSDRASFILARYPIESVTAMDTKNQESDSWTAQDLGLIKSIASTAGIIYLADSADAGSYWNKVRFTFTGGYWWDTTEPKQGDPAAMPEGAFALPPALLGAWLLQCREVWNKVDKLGSGLVEKPDTKTVLSDLELVSSVKQTLTRFTQMDLI